MLTNLRKLLIEEKVPLTFRRLSGSLRNRKDRIRYMASEFDAFDAGYSILVSIHNMLIYWLDLAQEFNAGCGESTEQIEYEYKEPERSIVLQQQKIFQEVWQLVLDIENYLDEDDDDIEKLEDEHDIEKLKDMFSRLAELLPSLWI